MQLLIAWIRLGWHLGRALPAAGLYRLPQRLLLFVLLWAGMGLLTLLHLLGFAADEVLFRRYRSVVVRQPVFIVGVPRSGTTFLQRLLAEDTRFTSLTLWECLLAPSISERYVWSFLGRLCAPVRRGLSRWRWRALERRHPLGWTEPEEDFLLLFYRGACFLPALICPRSDAYWRLAFFDQTVGAAERKSLMGFYHRCLQRHLYFHGTDKRLLSKNPSFTPMVDSLRGEFPDARFIACARNPAEALPSQLSSLAPALALAGQTPGEALVRERLTTILHHYYRRLNGWRAAPDVWLLPLEELPRLLKGGLRELYAFVGQPLPIDVERRVRVVGDKRNRQPSTHRYRAVQFGLNEARLRHHFADVWPIPASASAEKAA